MVCIYCGAHTHVINSRLQTKLNRIWRRRSCTTCGSTFTTSELSDTSLSVMVEDEAKALTPLVRDKLFLSIYESCRHRRSAVADAGALTDTVMAKLLKTDHGGTLSRLSIQETAHKALQHFDTAAATHYNAYYFSDRNL